MTTDQTWAELARHFKLIRSKDAGPFMLTIDLFFSDRVSLGAFLASGVLDAESIARIYGVAAPSVQRWVIPEIDAVKISFPRRVPSGDPGDTDITGGQQYAVLVEALAASTALAELRKENRR
jgi:hypothetical protein